MKDVVASARRGLECLVHPRVAAVLFGTGLLWMIANSVLGWIVLGPALVVLFRICLKSLRGERAFFLEENLAIAEDLPAALVAGILLALPFKLWVMLDDLCRQANAADAALEVGIPATASAALFIHFAYHIFTFPVLAERHCGMLEASAESRRIADAPGRGGSRVAGFGRHVLLTSAVLAVVLIASAWYTRTDVPGFVLTIVAGPPAVMLLSAWYLQLTGFPATERDLVEAADSDVDAPELEDEP